MRPIGRIRRVSILGRGVTNTYPSIYESGLLPRAARAYMSSNIDGFFCILEACREFQPKHLIFASSSSVYGMNTSIPFTESDKTDFPISLYARGKLRVAARVG